MRPYQGARAQADAPLIRRVFAVSKLRLDSNGAVAEVLWAEANAKSNLGVGAPVRAPVSEVVDAIHAGHEVIALFEATQATEPERPFVIVDHSDGHETIIFDGPDVPGRGLQNIAMLASRNA
jgi:hypothetical protein